MLDSAFGDVSTFNKPEFTKTFAEALACDEKQLIITNITNGSVVVDMSIVSLDTGATSGNASVAYLKELAERNAMVLRRMQIIAITLYEPDGTPIIISFGDSCPPVATKCTKVGPCPGIPGRPCNGNGNADATGADLNGCIKPGPNATGLATCACKPGFGLGDCRNMPALLQVPL